MILPIFNSTLNTWIDIDYGDINQVIMTASIDAVAKTLDSEPDIVLSSSNRHREWVGLALNNTTDRFITGSNKLDSITYTTVMMVYDTLYALENTVLTFGGNSNK